MLSTQDLVLRELEAMTKGAKLEFVVDKSASNVMYVRPTDETFAVKFNMFLDFQTKYFIAKIEKLGLRWYVENGNGEQLQQFLRAFGNNLGLALG